MSALVLPRPRPGRLVAAAVLVALAILAPGAQAAAKPKVLPKGACTETRGKQLVAVFDVSVRGKKAAKVKKGKRNKVSGGRVVGKLPTSFAPGATRRALRVAFARRSKRTKWRLGAKTATVKRAAKRCAVAKTANPSRTNANTPARPRPVPIGAGYCTSSAVTNS
jgi:hypothetical protein